VTTSAPKLPLDPRAAEAMRKYMAILNAISALGVHGFAQVLDTASPAEMTELISAADIVQRNLDRVRSR
jgi:hypothetical protein